VSGLGVICEVGAIPAKKSLASSDGRLVESSEEIDPSSELGGEDTFSTVGTGVWPKPQKRSRLRGFAGNTDRGPTATVCEAKRCDFFVRLVGTSTACTTVRMMSLNKSQMKTERHLCNTCLSLPAMTHLLRDGRLEAKGAFRS
jgi:hypothetical protein